MSELGHRVEAQSWGMELGRTEIDLMRSIQKPQLHNLNFDLNFLIGKLELEVEALSCWSWGCVVPQVEVKLGNFEPPYYL